MATVEISGQEINIYEQVFPISDVDTVEKMSKAVASIVQDAGTDSYVEYNVVENGGVSIVNENIGRLVTPPSKGSVKIVFWYFYEESSYTLDTSEANLTLVVKNHVGTDYLIGYRDGDSICSPDNIDSDEWCGDMVSIMLSTFDDENLDACAMVLKVDDKEGEGAAAESFINIMKDEGVIG